MSLFDEAARLKTLSAWGGSFARMDNMYRRIQKANGGYWRLRYLRGNLPGGFKPVFRWVYTLVILLILTACTTTPHTVALKPPAELTEGIPKPVLPEKPTNGDLARALDESFDVIDELNRRLAAIRGL